MLDVKGPRAQPKSQRPTDPIDLEITFFLKIQKEYIWAFIPLVKTKNVQTIMRICWGLMFLTTSYAIVLGEFSTSVLSVLR